MKKVPASEATRKRLEEVFSIEHIDPGRMAEGTRLLIEQAWRPRSSALGRRHDEHSKGGEDDAARAMRNGVRRAHLDSAEGVNEFDVPQLRGLTGWRRSHRALAPWPARSRSSRAWRWRCTRAAVDARHRGRLHR